MLLHFNVLKRFSVGKKEQLFARTSSLVTSNGQTVRSPFCRRRLDRYGIDIVLVMTNFLCHGTEAANFLEN